MAYGGPYLTLHFLLGWPVTVVLGLVTAVVAWLRPKRLTVVALLSFVAAIALTAMSLSDPYYRRRMGSQDWVILAIFCGPVALVGFVALAISSMDRRRRRRPVKPPRCRQCGYDLRGSIEAARCPECGTSFVPPTLPGATPEKAPEGGQGS